ncbi:Rrf2 family transcriptional regulator [Chitinophaga sp.]|uniref:RrF2 family transcriptional regulator n=1 Tax=Chitinophaga sp. TaxID=1869181 RepID=UPI00261717B8|nr:Rrf2 family transcriptional regulator [uncultured Chitinophaga sp.]
MLSRACEYGIKAAVYLAQRSKEGQMSNVRDIAEAIGSPVAFTAKVLQQLARKGLISSMKGAKGGFYIEAKTLRHLNLCTIVNAIDGNGITENCMLGLRECSEKNPCPVHHQYKHIKAGIIKMLNESMVNNLTIDVEKKLSVLKN